MIPEFNSNGNLPPGLHWTDWQEFSERFGTTPHRQRLIRGLTKAARSLQAAGCSTIYIDGSFVTNKEAPGDYDGCWDVTGVDPSKLDPVLLIFTDKRAAQKLKFLGELFPAQMPQGLTGETFLNFFQSDRNGNEKGVVGISLQRTQL